MATCFDLKFIKTGNYAFKYKSDDFQESVKIPSLNAKKNKRSSYT
jgi:hypothetical protein